MLIYTLMIREMNLWIYEFIFDHSWSTYASNSINPTFFVHLSNKRVQYLYDFSETFEHCKTKQQIEDTWQIFGWLA